MGNIVKAVVGKNGKTIKTAPLYQYDYGQILQIEGIELPAAYQVHFSNDPMGDSTTSIGNENGVAIPDTYLASGETVYAWIYLHTGEDDGETVLNIVIPVRQRAAITNETPTPQQQSEIDQLISEMNAAVDEAEDAQAAAEEAAEQAEAQVEKYPIIVDGYWAFWDEASEQYVKSNQKAQGPKGDPGDPGDPSSLIDDTSTGLDKAWSASKSNTLLSEIAIEETYINANQYVLAQSGICVNMLNPNAITNNMAIRTSNGTIYANTGTAVSDFIPVKSGKKYSFFRYDNGEVKLSTAGRVIGFTSEKSFGINIGEINSNNKTCTIPTGIAYIRFQYSSSTYSTAHALMFCEVMDETVPSKFYTYGQTDFKVSDFAKASYVEDNISRIDENIKDITDVFDVSLKTMTGTLETGKFIESNGTITDLSSYQLLKVAVEPFTDYWISARAYYRKYYCIFHDASGNLLDGGIKATEAGTTTITDVKITAPENAAFVYVTSPINDNVQAVKEFDHYEIPTTAKKWAGKKWAVVGDSLTEVNQATTKHYCEYIADETGISVSNMGVGGTGYCRGYDTNRAFYQRISSVPTDADVVTIFGSGNDMNIEAMSKFDGMTWAQALGTYTDNTTDTICGCINVTIDNYFTVMPVVPIGIIAPAPWKSYPTTKLTGNRFEDYTNALKQIAAYRGVPFLDLYHHSNLRPEDETNCNACFYNGSSLDGNGDGVHPNELGHKIIASKIYEFVKTILLG